MFALRNKATVLALALALAAMTPAVSRADTVQAQPIYAQNNTSHTIWVAARYIPPGSTSYVSDGWWEVGPGQRVLILYNNGVNIYFNAHDDADTVWDGNDATAVVRGETLNMFQQDTGTGYQPWTMHFNP